MNNPFRYRDPDGRFIFAVPLLALTWKVLAVAVATAVVSYELEHQHRHSDSALARGFNSAAHEMVQSIGGVSQYALNHKLDAKKKKKPPFDGKELGGDPTQCPGEGFEWKGKGEPGSNQGRICFLGKTLKKSITFRLLLINQKNVFWNCSMSVPTYSTALWFL